VKKKLLILGGGLVILCGIYFDINVTYKCDQYFIDQDDDISTRKTYKADANHIKVTRIDSFSRTGRRYFKFEEGDRECRYVFIKEPYVADIEI
jgi:uncharacterized protein YxeA